MIWVGLVTDLSLSSTRLRSCPSARPHARPRLGTCHDLSGCIPLPCGDDQESNVETMLLAVFCLTSELVNTVDPLCCYKAWRRHDTRDRMSALKQRKDSRHEEFRTLNNMSICEAAN